MKAKLTQILCLLTGLLTFFATIKNTTAGGGDVVGNGGGLSEQALVYSAQHFDSFLDSCLKVHQCAASGSEHFYLSSLKSCDYPNIQDLRFSTAKDLPELTDGTPEGRPYVKLTNETFVINRTHLYPPHHPQPLRVATAMAYLARLYLDACQIFSLPHSQELGTRLARFSDFDSERVTIGKDQLDLPPSKWIRVRTFYGDLILETTKTILRLSCPTGELESCSLSASGASAKNSSFRHLSVLDEHLEIDKIVFEVEGSFRSESDRTRVIHLRGEFLAGGAVAIWLNGRTLSIPKEEQ